MIAPQSATIPPLVSGGVMLTYRCTNACKHCLYRCSPQHEPHFASPEQIDATFAALTREPRLSGVHLAGGEATLNWDRLVYAIRSARKHHVTLDYLETNASWCRDEETARTGFERLHRAGLDGVLISASLFHNEFTPLAFTKAAVRAAWDVFGRSGVLIWTPDVLSRMDRGLDEDRRHTLKRSCELLGIDVENGELWQIHGYLNPGGRCAEQLQSGLSRHSAETLEGSSCKGTLASTHHFHIDPFGNLYSGHCPGISVATIEDLHPRISEKAHPLFWRLWEEGPFAVWRDLASDFRPDASGDISKCHFCLELRKHLRGTASGRFGELKPDEYYE